MLDVQRELRRNGYVAIRDRRKAAHLSSYGFSPDVVVDVGVDTGTPELYAAFPDAKFVLIDAREEVAANLKTAPSDYDFVCCGVGRDESELELRIPMTAKGRANARAGFREIMGPMSGSVQSVETRRVPVRPLDAIMRDYPGRVGLKIDTEGFEFEVIEGATDTLERTEFAILELSLTQRFADVAQPSAVIELLSRKGLELRDVLSLPGDGRGGPAPRYIDALFTRWDA